MRELRWFGLTKRRRVDAPVKRCKRLVIEGMKRGKKYLGNVIRQDML